MTTREHVVDGRTVECDNGWIDNGITWRPCPECEADDAENADDLRFARAERWASR